MGWSLSWELRRSRWFTWRILAHLERPQAGVLLQGVFEKSRSERTVGVTVPHIKFPAASPKRVHQIHVHYLTTTTMSPIRTPLALINVNKLPGHRLTPIRRAEIIFLHKAGISNAEIQRIKKQLKSTVKDTIRKELLRNNHKSLSSTGRLIKYSDQDESTVLQLVRLQLKLSYQEVLRQTGVTSKIGTLKKILQEHGISKWHAVKRPFLTQDHANKRLVQAQDHYYQEPHDQDEIIQLND